MLRNHVLYRHVATANTLAVKHTRKGRHASIHTPEPTHLHRGSRRCEKLAQNTVASETQYRVPNIVYATQHIRKARGSELLNDETAHVTRSTAGVV